MTSGDENRVVLKAVLPRRPLATADGAPPTRDHAASDRTSPGKGTASHVEDIGHHPPLPRSTIEEVSALRQREKISPARSSYNSSSHRHCLATWRTKLRSIHGSSTVLEGSGGTNHDCSTPRAPFLPRPARGAAGSHPLSTSRLTRKGRSWPAPCSDTKVIPRQIRATRTKFEAHALRLSPADSRDSFAVPGIIRGGKGALK